MNKLVKKTGLALAVKLAFFQASVLALPQTFTVEVPRPDGTELGTVTLELTQYSVRDPNAFEVYLDEQSYAGRKDPAGADKRNFTKQDINNLPVRTYRGQVLEQPNSTVVAVIWPGDNTMSATINEGRRELWELKDIQIDIDQNDQVTMTSPESEHAAVSKLNTGKSGDWVPSFGDTPLDLSGISYPANIDRTLNHGWPIAPEMTDGITRVQIAIDAEPEWLTTRAGDSLERGLAIIEHSVNVLDLAYVRDVSMSHVLTGYVQRTDTNLHDKAADSLATWKDNGLGINPGSTGASADKSIPFQQLIMAAGSSEGNPVAVKSQQPLTGGNLSRVSLKDFDAGGLSHEVGHNWGGRHFVYPRDSMSGGGPWFGPTTAQRMIFLRDDAAVGGGLPKISNQTYGWNVHPYATPDLVRTAKEQSVNIDVLSNDFDGNNDAIGIAQFETTTAQGGTVTQLNDKQLVYTPPAGFTGRDSFNYRVTDSELHNDTWVQVDVGNEELINYEFELLGQTGEEVQDTSGSGLNGALTNFASPQLDTGIKGSGLRFPWMLTTTASLDDDNARAFVDFGDVVDPFDGDHAVSMWVKFDQEVLSSGLDSYLISNSSSTQSNLIAGYTIYADTNAGTLNFEIKEQLGLATTVDDAPLRNLVHTPVGGLVADQWYHVALVIDRITDTAHAYVNNSQVTGTITLEAGSFIKGKPSEGRYISAGLGINTYKPKKFGGFAGVMDEVRIFNKSLSVADIDALYNLQELPDTEAPLAPNGLIATAGDAEVSLSWDANQESDLDSYNLLRSLTSGSGFNLLESGLTSSSYIDNSVNNDTTYYYVVEAVDTSANVSPQSDEVSATPEAVGGNANTFTAGDTPIVISSSGTPTIESTLDVSGINGPISHLSVKLNITHVRDKDLKITLYSPDGTKRVLANKIGGTGDHFIDTVIDDNATQPLNDGKAPFTGSYYPAYSLDKFYGLSANGTWKLKVQDLTSGKGGSLDNWSLTITD